MTNHEILAKKLHPGLTKFIFHIISLRQTSGSVIQTFYVKSIRS